MDISNWSMDQILQLPDYCLSRRFLVSVSVLNAPDEVNWDISELSLPDRTILHECVIGGAGTFGKFFTLRLALGDQLPTATAEMDRLEPLFMGMGIQGADPREIYLSTAQTIAYRRLRQYVPAQGRRLLLELTTATGTDAIVTVGIVVSAVPRSIPDWFRLV